MKPATAQTSGYYAAFFILGAVIASLGPTIPFLAGNTGVGLEVVGALFTLRSMGYMLGSLLSGRLYDRLPGHRLQAGALLVAAISMFIVPILDQFWLLCLAMLLVGLSEGAVDVGANTQLAWVHGARSGPYLNGMFLVAGIGGFLTPLLMERAAASGLGVRWGYWGIALLNLPVALWLLRTPSPDRLAHARRSGNLSAWVFAAICLLAFLYIGAEVGLNGWIYTYMLQTGLADTTSAARLNSLYWLGITLGRLVSIPLAVRVRTATLVMVNLVGVLLGMALILVFPASAGATWAGVFVAGLFLASIFPLTFAYLEQQAPVTGSRAGLLWGSGSFGAMLVPWLIGVLFQSRGPGALPQLQVLIWVLALGLFVAVTQLGDKLSKRLN